MKNEKVKNLVIIILATMTIVLATLLVLELTGVLNFKDNIINNNEIQNGESNNSNTNDSILTSSNDCINNNTICENGTLVNVKVNDKENYDFYVIADTGTELTLIMDRNLGDNVAWINAVDYDNANLDNTNCPNLPCNDEGPITAVAALKERTANWINIEEQEVNNYNDYAGIEYALKKPIYTRARLLTKIEVDNLGCTSSSCPSWLYTNLTYNDKVYQSRGYWLMTTGDYSNSAYNLYQELDLKRVYPASDYVFRENYGIRPVITIQKNI